MTSPFDKYRKKPEPTIGDIVFIPIDQLPYKGDSEGVRPNDGVYCHLRKRKGLQPNGRVHRIDQRDDEVIVEFFTDFSWDKSDGDVEVYHLQTFYDGGWEPRPLGQWHLNR